MCPCGGIVREVKGWLWQCDYCGTLYGEPPDLAESFDRDEPLCDLCDYRPIATACPAGDHCARCCPPGCVL